MAVVPKFQRLETPERFRVYTRDLIGVLLLFLLSLIAGLGLNRFHSQSIPLVYQSPEQRLAAQLTTLIDAPAFQTSDLQTMGFSEFRQLVSNGSAFILDARSATFYEQGHVPGALNLARDDFAHDYQTLSAKLKGYRDKPVVVYCSGGSCHDSKMVANALLSLGFSNVTVFTGGWEEWTQANMPTAKN
jgi:rhodanese-related sulfurtransferase